MLRQRFPVLFAPARNEDLHAAFKVLGLSPSPKPTVNDVRLRYRELARLHHPDLSSGDDNKMKVINTAYELIQTSGVLLQKEPLNFAGADAGAPGSAASGGAAAAKAGARTGRTAGSRRQRVPDDFASGDDSSWAMKTTMEWERLVHSTDNITEQELRNPANHPFSHSKFYSFEDDATIYRMIRGGATVPQVARTLGKPATFIEKRLQNAQFKQRIQYLLRHQKAKQSRTEAARQQQQGSSLRDRQAGGVHPAKPKAPNMTAKVLRDSPYENEEHYLGSIRGGGRSSSSSAAAAAATGGGLGKNHIKKEWMPTYPEWRAPQFFEDMTLEEKGRFHKIIPDEQSGRPYNNYTRLKHGKR